MKIAKSPGRKQCGQCISPAPTTYHSIAPYQPNQNCPPQFSNSQISTSASKFSTHPAPPPAGYCQNSAPPAPRNLRYQAVAPPTPPQTQVQINSETSIAS